MDYNQILHTIALYILFYFAYADVHLISVSLAS